ncbi:hypothetical protein Taro_002685 [Colocasia esculenta]|uniref:Uncharacterized protein n=1 Tax=Colocasia esculenta TaxID=4460 RepID=A0A843TLL0_COLES|nr:hypothetical protein [Colocasia esculenta]
MLRLRHPLRHRRPFLPSLPANVSPQLPFLLRFDPAPSLFFSIRTSPPAPFSSSHASPLRSPLRHRCSSEGGDAVGPGDTLKGFVGEQVEALLRKEENRALMDGLVDASRRVETARRALADIGRQEAEAARAKEYVLQLESRRSEVVGLILITVNDLHSCFRNPKRQSLRLCFVYNSWFSDLLLFDRVYYCFKIDETQKELEQARTMVVEAERSLSLNMDNTTSQGAYDTNVTGEINKERERLESIKAALISSIVGTLAGLPISFYQASSSIQLVAHLAVIFISCALFGVTFRYTMRRDLDNIQLKTGICAAFGFVRGLSAAETSKPWEFDNINFLPLAVDGATYVLEGTLIFIFSAVALDYCIKMGFLSPFSIKK